LVDGWLKQQIPTSNRWFDEANFVETEELGALLRGLKETTVPWLMKTKELNHQTTLGTSTGSFLDTIGQGFGISRNLNETDDDYAIRIQQELLIDRVTLPAILAGLLRLVPHATIFEPWTELCKPSEDLLLSDNCHLGSPDYWNAAVFDVTIYPTSGAIDITSFLEFMKAYGVKAWYTVHMPDQFIDYNDDPLVPVDDYDLLPNGNQDPRTSKRDQLVVTANLELETNDVPDFVEGWMPSCLGGEGSGYLTPSGFEVIPFHIDIVSDLNLDVRKPVFCGDILRVASLDRNAPTFAQAELAGFVLNGQLTLSDLSKNIIIEPDIVASEAAGQEIYDIIRPDYFVGTLHSEAQGPVWVTQAIGLGDPEVLGGGAVLGTPMNF
jgi:hypothetical protein